MYKDSFGIINFKGEVEYYEEKTNEIEVDGKKYTNTERENFKKKVIELSTSRFSKKEYKFNDIGITEIINDYDGFSGWGLSRDLGGITHSKNEDANRIISAFNEGVLNPMIIDVFCSKSNRHSDNDYNVSKGYYSFELFSYGFNNSVYYSVKIDDLHDIDSINEWDVKRLENHYRVLNQSKCYILKDENTGMYKIGKSKDPKNREKTLQSEKPTIKMIKVFKKDIESKLHNIYKSQRVRGEWFNLTKLQVHYICTHY